MSTTGSTKIAKTEMTIRAASVELKGTLALPPKPRGLVIFAHGSGSGRFSPRNQFVAQTLNQAGLATLLFDLLTREEEILDEQTRELRFNILLLADRLAAATARVAQKSEVNNLPLGFFGASTGAAAALIAAAQLPDQIKAVVSRGGRPDLAGEALSHVLAPTLLIVGGEDRPVIDLNQQALGEISGREKEIVIIPGATHLFEEPGALGEVARLAGHWFTKYL